MSTRTHILYATSELLAQVNPKNADLWTKYINGKNTLSESTKNSYLSDINQFFVYILLNYENKFLFDFSSEDASDMMDDYVAMCKSVFGNKDRRIARRLSAISSMYIYYKRKRRVKENPVELLERPKLVKGKYEVKQTFLTIEQVEVIRQKLYEIDNTQLNLFFELGLYSMARVNALANITIKQINYETQRIERVIEKEGYEVELMMNTRIIELVQSWLKERDEKGIKSDLLFITKYNNSWNNAKSAMQDTWIKKIGEFIGEEELHCHDLRHSGSNLKFQAGMSLEYVSKALNHKGTQVTQDHYLRIDYNKIQSDMEKFSV